MAKKVEDVTASVPASLEGMDDDTVLIVTSFLPECRDVLSLSVTRALPETAWRAAHKSLLPTTSGRGPFSSGSAAQPPRLFVSRRSWWATSSSATNTMEELNHLRLSVLSESC